MKNAFTVVQVSKLMFFCFFTTIFTINDERYQVENDLEKMCVHISPRSTTETLYNVCHAHWWCCDTAIETHQKQSKAPGMRRQPMGGKRSNMAAKRRMLVKERGGDTASLFQKRCVLHVDTETRSGHFFNLKTGFFLTCCGNFSWKVRQNKRNAKTIYNIVQRLKFLALRCRKTSRPKIQDQTHESRRTSSAYVRIFQLVGDASTECPLKMVWYD
ncbi:hypothetical protein AMECASPLE_023511 [Ameca splendens]|uniref:Secreted protein n=1 Tax=Ameca splendens TaxID=208324 RepID=A0ABV0ZE86_9TELE